MAAEVRWHEPLHCLIQPFLLWEVEVKKEFLDEFIKAVRLVL